MTSSLHAWFCCNGKCLNPMKSEATLLGSSRCLQSFPVIHDVSIASSVSPTTDKDNSWGYSWFQANIRCSYICRLQECTLSPPSFTQYQIPLTTDMATSIAVALVQSRLDYANSLLYRVSTRNIHKLQRCQNTAAHLILQQSFTPSIQDLMNQLHWLPIQVRIDVKIATLTYKALSSGQPAYLRE